MRVVHFSKYYYPAFGGMETHVQTLAQAQATLGAEVHVIGINHLDPNSKDLTKSKLGRSKARVFDDGPVKVHLLGRFAHFAKCDFALGLKDVLKKTRELRPDVWHLHSPNITFAIGLVRSSIESTFVITHHSDVLTKNLLYRLFSRLESRIYERADLIISDSEQYISGSHLLKRHRDKVRVLPLGVDLDPYINPNEEAIKMKGQLETNCGGPIWLCAGRLCHYKGLHMAVSALRFVPGTLLMIR